MAIGTGGSRRSVLVAVVLVLVAVAVAVASGAGCVVESHSRNASGSYGSGCGKTSGSCGSLDTIVVAETRGDSGGGT